MFPPHTHTQTNLHILDCFPHFVKARYTQAQEGQSGCKEYDTDMGDGDT